MGSAAVAPQPHGAEEARGGRAAGHILGPGAARFRAPGPENGPAPGLQAIKERHVKGRRENPGKEREGKGKAKQDQAAFRQPGLERTASGENQNTPSFLSEPRHSCAAAHRSVSPRRRRLDQRGGT